MNNLTALVLTYNEEDNIAACLDSLMWVPKVVVIDSLSSDKTEEICLRYKNVSFFEREFDDFASQRNYGLEQVDKDWVLVVDADERITDSLQGEIKKILSNPEAEGYNIARKNYFLGKWIKYCGWYPDYTLRLFKSVYRYQGLVHETPEIDGKIEKLDNDFIHYTYSNLKEYVSKMNQYTSLDAEKKYQKGKKIGVSYILVRPILEFVKKFFLKKGFLLGVQGLILSLLSSYYQFLKSIKLWELNNISEDEIK